MPYLFAQFVDLLLHDCRPVEWQASASPFTAIVYRRRLTLQGYWSGHKPIDAIINHCTGLAELSLHDCLALDMSQLALLGPRPSTAPAVLPALT